MIFRPGYVAQNLTLGLRTGRTFRLANLSEERLVETARANLADLFAIVADAARHEHRMSAFILGVVQSPAFRMMGPDGAEATTGGVAGGR